MKQPVVETNNPLLAVLLYKLIIQGKLGAVMGPRRVDALTMLRYTPPARKRGLAAPWNITGA